MSAGAVDVLAIKTALGLTDCREGSRAIGHCGPENGEWEDYIEVPVSKLAAVAELIAERDALRWALSEYPKRNPHQLQSRKVCEGVAALAAQEARRHG